MATSKKTKKNKAPDPKKMKADVTERIEVKKLLKDERSHKIAGTLLILISILLFFAFTSYLFTWQEDQSKVFKGAKILLPSHAEPMANLLGTAGAYFSDLFFRSGFGIASYLFCTFFFVVGVNLFAPRKIFSVWRNIRYVIVGLLIISVSASFLFYGHSFPWGGAVGDYENHWLQQVIGKVGTASVLLVALMSYIIWRFNPSFNFMDGKFSSLVKSAKEKGDTFFSEPESGNTGFENSTEHILPIKNIAAGNDEGLQHEFEIIERPEQRIVNPEPIKEPKPRNIVPQLLPESGLQLEVKSVPAEFEKEVQVTSKPRPTQPYDPILDLRNYKFPTIDLLEVHGSEKMRMNWKIIKTRSSTR